MIGGAKKQSRQPLSASRASGRQGPRRVAAERHRLGLVAGPATATLVVLYHAFLLWQRIADLTLLEPAVAARWVFTLIFLLGLARLHQRGVPLVWGRKALVFWLLVLLLHLSFYGPLAEKVQTGFDLQRVEWILALPVAVAVAVFAVCCLGLLATVLRTLAERSVPLWSLLDAFHRPSLRRGWTLQLACRPPPA